MGKSRSGTNEPIRCARTIPIVGRDRERAALLAALRPGWLVFVSGDAGVGKTALVTAVAADASVKAPIIYVPDCRTRASACAGIATALTAHRLGRSARARQESRMRRVGPKARGTLIAGRRTGSERAVIFDHVDFPGPRLDELVDLWRERTAVVLVARSEATLGKLHRHLYDCSTIRLERLVPSAATVLAQNGCRMLDLLLRDGEMRALVRLAGGLPALICRVLRLRSHRDYRDATIEQLTRRARLEALAGERDAIIRGRRRLERSRQHKTARETVRPAGSYRVRRSGL